MKNLENFKDYLTSKSIPFVITKKKVIHIDFNYKGRDFRLTPDEGWFRSKSKNPNKMYEWYLVFTDKSPNYKKTGRRTAVRWNDANDLIARIEKTGILDWRQYD